MIIWQITLQTTHFLFEGYGRTEEEANEAIGRAIKTHGARLDLDDDWWSDYEFNTRTIVIGVGYRDGELIG